MDLNTTAGIMLGVADDDEALRWLGFEFMGLKDPWDMVDPPGAAGPAAGAEPPLRSGDLFIMSLWFTPRPLCANWSVGNCILGRSCPDRHDMLLPHQRLIVFIGGAEVSLDICVYLITDPQVSTIIIPPIVVILIFRSETRSRVLLPVSAWHRAADGLTDQIEFAS